MMPDELKAAGRLCEDMRTHLFKVRIARGDETNGEIWEEYYAAINFLDVIAAIENEFLDQNSEVLSVEKSVPILAFIAPKTNGPQELPTIPQPRGFGPEHLTPK